MMMYDWYYENRKWFIAFFIIASLGAAFMLPKLGFSFNFEQFFPKGDPDLEFFQEFVEEFETDDNFLLLAIEHDPSIFDTSFLRQLKVFTKDCRKEIPYLKRIQSIVDFKYPLMTPFGPTTIPAIHFDIDKLKKDSIRLMNDPRMKYNLINESASSTVVLMTMEDNIELDASREVMSMIHSLIAKHGLGETHMLGRAYFQDELSRLQFTEILLSTIVSGILVSIIMILIFRRVATIVIALGSIGLGLLLFLGILSASGRELTIMAALYPVLMLIVGTSDVVHILTKYLDELKRGLTRKQALHITIKEIGLATLLTSLTTAVGFATLMTSKVVPIKDFGINSALGVILAYIVVIGFTCSLISYFPKERLLYSGFKKDYWSRILNRTYVYTRENGKLVTTAFIFLIVLFAFGISKVHTNYDLTTNFPKGEKVTEDFQFFEREYAGFRPLELAGTVGPDYDIYDYEVQKSISDAENHLRSLPEIQTTLSLATVVKSINQMLSNARQDAYRFPDEKNYKKTYKIMKRIPDSGVDALVSVDARKTRISSKIKDVGAENIKALSGRIDNWLDENIDRNIISFKQTGTGLLLDKNSEFVKDSLFEGLLIALLIVSILMGLLFKNFKMVFLALVPNVLPLLFAAALLGYFNIALEAGISIVFAIVFGIAVDDTIHFLSKYKLSMDKYGDQEKALQVTYLECGKAIIFTSIILFFGFLVLLFSKNQPSVVIGMLISVTLLSALVADLTILPVLMRRFRV